MKVLAYHKIVSRENFERQLKYLLKRHDFPDRYQDKENSVIITSDDGDPSFYHNAFPILKKYDLPAILFVITGLIDSDEPFWWDEIEYYLGKDEGNRKVWEIKAWPNSKREAYLERLRKRSNKPLLEYKQLTTAQLKEMQEAGIIIANHSHTHPIFDQCSQSELEKEMVQSINILKKSGFTPYIFAYPNGNYSEETEVVLKKFGIKKAFLFDHKINGCNNLNSLRISRLIVNDTTPLWKFKLILSGWHTKILPVTKALGKLRKKIK